MAMARTKSVTVRLDVDLNRRLDRYCKDEVLTKSLVVNCALAHFFGARDKARFEIIKGYVARAKRKK